MIPTFRRPGVLVPTEVLLIYSDLNSTMPETIDWESESEQDLWRELCLCILSANTLYETASSAARYLDAHHLLRELMGRQDDEILAKLIGALSSGCFEPPRSDGSLRKYRFPSMRARQIRDAARILYPSGAADGLRDLLGSFSTEEEARDFLSTEVPGLAMKEASHFLRNIGYARNLAVIDVHIRRFLCETLDLTWSSVNANAAKYRELEDLMRYIADTNGLELALLDVAIWNYMRLREF